jgi:hypothetical protein
MTTTLAGGAGAATVGFILGAAYFTSLWRSVRTLAGAQQGVRYLALGALCRLAALTGIVGALLWLGLEPLLMLIGCAGFLAARMAATASLSLGRDGPMASGPKR